ncbi:hypothetical protein N7492_001366 [Penicillium capsulatum]|uniref:Phytanoyl-CoA dioxygenase n=1 Tax=Penicillium capsulatum TaxID=69766 RepID=A0A9W9IVG6_9EURO|nr:hypothetical protein N7492_001366 [Penicillium capsulatum]KAJ6129580.1 hypothetical protein N7512_002360 [Penicillium capsulatum]
MSTRIYQLSSILLRPRAAQVNAKCPIISSRAFSRLSRASPATEIAQRLKSDGRVVIESMFTPSQVSRLNADLDTACADIPVGRPANANTPPLPDRIDAELFGQNTKRLGNLAAFREEVIDDDIMHDAAAEIFKETGDYWLSTAQMIEPGPGSKAQPLHADAAGWWPFWSMGDQWTPDFTVNFLIATTDTTEANGATGVVRGSHKIKYTEAMHDTDFGLWRFPDDEVEQIKLKAGDCLLLEGRVVHRGEENKTSDEFRRLLN